MASTTACVANGFVQGNLVILPADLAATSSASASSIQNPARSIGITEPGDPAFPHSAPISTCAPTCRAIASGATASGGRADRHPRWRDDLVAFVHRLSFSSRRRCWPTASTRHVERGANVSMFRTNRLHPAGPSLGPLVVTMRPLKAGRCDPRVQITSRFPAVHGAPVHLGHPRDRHRRSRQARLWRRGAVGSRIPVFWACGVTPQAGDRGRRLPFAITHAPGAMLVTDLRNKQLAVL